jgi:hypothetical protein
MQRYISAADDGKDIFAMLIFIKGSSKHVRLYDLLHNKPHGNELMRVPALPP